jgi:Outer membrane receptor for ferrienterochelin and colicins
MNKYIFILISLCYFLQAEIAVAQRNTDANIVGHVLDKKTGEHLSFINVYLRGTTFGVTTDLSGHYHLRNLPEGEFILEARFVGYKSVQQVVNPQRGKTLEINFELEEDNVSLNEVVVSANRNETERRMAPTLVSVLDAKVFERTSAVSIAEGLKFQPGLRMETNCQNCGFTQIRMNGMAGAYTQILMDSRPIFSALTGVYGLEQIPANMVERIEVIRGGGSALFGSAAIAGTINVITKEPLRNTGQIAHTLTAINGTNDFENNTTFNASLVSDNQKMGLMVFGQKRERGGYDHDSDGFSELPALKNRTLGFRSYIKTGTYSKLTLEYHNMHEYRRGGDNLKGEAFDSWIAEQLETSIDGGGLNYTMSSDDYKNRLNLYASAQITRRDSYYGGGRPAFMILDDMNISESDRLEELETRLSSVGKTRGETYVAGTQYSHDFDQLLFMPSTLTSGLEFNRDNLYDKSGYRNEAISQNINIYSWFLQNEWKSDMWGFLVGGRLDKHSAMDNAVISPRANIRYNPISDVNIRLSYGQGFRAPQVFDEDLHVELASGAVVVREHDPNLKEERSHSYSASVDWYHRFGAVEMNFLAEGFCTNLIDAFAGNMETQDDGTIIKRITNASGVRVYGTNFEARMAYSTLLDIQAGATVQRSEYKEAQAYYEELPAEKRMMRTPNVYGFFVATLTPFKDFSTSFTGNYTGSMLVPHDEGYIDENRIETSRTFFEFGWQAGYTIPLYEGSDVELTVGVRNIFNAYQNDFDKGPDRASAYVYGPAMPRNFYAGVKLCF